MNDDEVRALLRELDDPRHLEWPRCYRRRAARARFDSLVEALGRAFECSTDVDGNVQDAGLHGSIRIPAEATDSDENIIIAISNFGNLAAVTLGGQGAHSDDELAVLFDENDQVRVQAALDGLGYVAVPERLLDERYDGPSPLRPSYLDYL